MYMYAINLYSIDAQCTDGDTYLVGSKYDFQGNVMVCYNGVWGYVCHDWFDENEAKVVCNNLGFSTNSK